MKNIGNLMTFELRKVKKGGLFSFFDLAILLVRNPMLAVGAGAAKLLGRTGVFESLSEKIKRASDDRIVTPPLPIGTPILVSLSRGVAEHSGIYLGNNAVAELSGDGKTQQVSLTEFLNGKDDAFDNFRSGTCVFAACDDETGEPLGLEDAMVSAKRLISRVDKVDYHLFGNNCHMFTASCLLDRMMRKMTVKEWLDRGAYTIQDLDEVISRIMNLNRSISWLRVIGPKKGIFEYNLTKNKWNRLSKDEQKRLEKEGFCATDCAS